MRESAAAVLHHEFAAHGGAPGREDMHGECFTSFIERPVSEGHARALDGQIHLARWGLRASNCVSSTYAGHSRLVLSGKPTTGSDMITAFTSRTREQCSGRRTAERKPYSQHAMDIHPAKDSHVR